MAQPGKNLPPTRRKLQEARKRGEVARYRDLVCFAAILAGGAACLWLLPPEVNKILLFARDVMAAAGTLGRPDVISIK